MISRHHANWRIKAMERHPNLKETELAYTSAMSISIDDAETVRRLAVTFIESVQKLRKNSARSEVAYFMNLDWIQL